MAAEIAVVGRTRFQRIGPHSVSITHANGAAPSGELQDVVSSRDATQMEFVASDDVDMRDAGHGLRDQMCFDVVVARQTNYGAVLARGELSIFRREKDNRFVVRKLSDDTARSELVAFCEGYEIERVRWEHVDVMGPVQVDATPIVSRLRMAPDSGGMLEFNNFSPVATCSVVPDGVRFVQLRRIVDGPVLPTSVVWLTIATDNLDHAVDYLKSVSASPGEELKMTGDLRLRYELGPHGPPTTTVDDIQRALKQIPYGRLRKVYGRVSYIRQMTGYTSTTFHDFDVLMRDEPDSDALEFTVSSVSDIQFVYDALVEARDDTAVKIILQGADVAETDLLAMGVERALLMLHQSKGPENQFRVVVRNAPQRPVGFAGFKETGRLSSLDVYGPAQQLIARKTFYVPARRLQNPMPYALMDRVFAESDSAMVSLLLTALVGGLSQRGVTPETGGAIVTRVGGMLLPPGVLPTPLGGKPLARDLQSTLFKSSPESLARYGLSDETRLRLEWNRRFAESPEKCPVCYFALYGPADEDEPEDKPAEERLLVRCANGHAFHQDCAAHVPSIRGASVMDAICPMCRERLDRPPTDEKVARERERGGGGA